MMFTLDWPLLSRAPLLGRGFVSGAGAFLCGLLALVAAAVLMGSFSLDMSAAAILRRALLLSLAAMSGFALFNLLRRSRNEAAFYGLGFGAAAAAMTGL